LSNGRHTLLDKKRLPILKNKAGYRLSAAHSAGVRQNPQADDEKKVHGKLPEAAE
jgi:hypothetical protein